MMRIFPKKEISHKIKKFDIFKKSWKCFKAIEIYTTYLM